MTDQQHPITPPPEPPTDDDLNRLRYYEFSTSTGHGEIVDVLGFARAVLERWGRDSRDDDDCISPQDLHDVACSLREGRKGLSKHIVYFQDEGKDKGIGVWAKNEEEAEVLAMETYAQIKKARAAELEAHG
jgi:hypothetical protein